MKSKETIQILSEIANSLDNYSLYKEATTVTRLMTKIAQAETTPEETTVSDTQYSSRKPMPKPDREIYYQKLIKEYKEKLLSGVHSAKDFYDHIHGNGPLSLQGQTVPNGFLTDDQILAFQKQFGRILRELTFQNVDQTFEMSADDKPGFIKASNEIHGMIDAYLRNRELTVKDLEDTNKQNEIIENLSKQLEKKHPGKNSYIKLLENIVTGYSRFESKPNVGNKTPQGSTPPPGGGSGDVRYQDRTQA
jgi:hypothetical protein